VDVLVQLAQNDPRYLNANALELSALRALPRELHDVYFARMFACFESDLRHYWRSIGRRTTPPTEHLLSSIAARRGIPQDTLDDVQRVREFRNHLIHEQHEVPRQVTIDEAIGYLNAYLARLPLEW
jgi:hypothetical protein